MDRYFMYTVRAISIVIILETVFEITALRKSTHKFVCFYQQTRI